MRMIYAAIKLLSGEDLTESHRAAPFSRDGSKTTGEPKREAII